jgi:hypothetical protein
LSNTQLVADIKSRLLVELHDATVSEEGKLMGLRYQPPRHRQQLTRAHIDAGLRFCQWMLANPARFPLIHFSDESRFVLAEDNRWVWYGRGEENECATVSTQKSAPSLMMVFAVIASNYKSKQLLFVPVTINTDKYIQNLEDTAVIKDLDERYGALHGIVQQESLD